MFLSAPAQKTTVSNHHTAYHRPRLEKYYVQVPQVLLREFADLSDGAKLTYQVLLSYDYIELHSDQHKGIVYPSIETLMAIRRKSRSTIYAHIAELEAYGLIEVLIGEGFRLYNPQEGATGDNCTQSLSRPEKAATANYSTQERPSQSGYENDEHLDANSSDRLIFQKSGRPLKEEEENQVTKQYHYSEAGESSLVVDKLLKLGFERYLARQFVARYGAAQVDEQITNLCRALQKGAHIRSFPRWLYRAIERGYCFLDAPMPRCHTATKTHRSIGEAKTLPNGDVVYEVMEYEAAG